MGNINSAIEQSSLRDPNPTFDTGLPIVNESNEDAKKVRYSNVSDADLNQHVAELQNQFPNCGTEVKTLLTTSDNALSWKIDAKGAVISWIHNPIIRSPFLRI